jgi:hypothetical protein
MRILKANTAVRLVVGPLCDKTTGLAKPSMTVTNMAMNMWHEHDDGSAPTKSIDAVSFTASGGNNDMVELAGGYYDIEITAAQLNITAGRASFCIYDDDVILPYFEEWLVVPANVFDSIMGTDTLDVMVTGLADDVITAAKFDESTAFPVKSADTGATQIARVGADSDTLETLSDQLDAIDDYVDTEVAAIKAKTDLITTGTTLSIASAVSGSTITAHRGDTLSAALADIGALTNNSKVWFTVKRDFEDADSAAIVQIEKTGGLLYINGAAGTAGNGSLTINDEATGDVTIVLAAAETAKLGVGSYQYDIQVLRSAGTPVSTLTYGEFIVDADVTKATA